MIIEIRREPQVHKRDQLYLYKPSISILTACFSVALYTAALIGCDAVPSSRITQRDEPLALLDDPTQVAQFELLEADTGRLIADGFSLRSIAQAPAPLVDGERVQATDVLFSGDTLLVSYNFRGEPHRGASKGELQTALKLALPRSRSARDPRCTISSTPPTTTPLP